jgi:hypothetical protein
MALDGDDLLREPLAARKATLASLLRRAAPGVRLNEHVEADGPTVFAHACRPGVRGGAARGGRGLEPMTEGKNRIMLYGAGADRPGRL